MRECTAVDPAVVVEALVLDREEGGGDGGGDLLKRDDGAALEAEVGDQPPVGGEDPGGDERLVVIVLTNQHDATGLVPGHARRFVVGHTRVGRLLHEHVPAAAGCGDAAFAFNTPPAHCKSRRLSALSQLPCALMVRLTSI